MSGIPATSGGRCAAARRWACLAFLALDTGLRAFMRELPPRPIAFGGVVLAMVARVIVVLSFTAAAAIRTRRGGIRVAPNWYSSTAVVFFAVGAAVLTIDNYLPIDWRTYNIPSPSNLPTLDLGDWISAAPAPAALEA